MVFDVSQYSRVVWSNIGGILFAFFILLLAIISVIKASSEKKRREGMLGVLLMLLFLVFIIGSSYPTLANGGLAFLMEKNDEPSVYVGEIESITEISELLPNNHAFGSDIVIDGEVYIAAEEGDFKAGDVIEIHYLENSRFVLEIHKIETE